MKRYALIIPFLLTVILLSTAATDSKEPSLEHQSFWGTIQLDIVSDEEIKNQVYSYITRELRALGDVKMVKKEPYWIIHIVCMQAKSKAGDVLGFAMSTLITQPSNIKEHSLKEMFGEKLTQWDYKVLASLFTGLHTIVSHKIYVEDPAELQRVCRRIVADFDAKYVKPEREQYQAFIKKVEDLKKKQEKKQGKNSIYD